MDDWKRISVERWLAKAQNDLLAAKTLLHEKPSITDVICFHAQQCVEKSLKGYLTQVGHHVEKTHHLPVLLTYCVQYDSELERFQAIAKRLTRYAVISRYPDDWSEILIEEASDAVKDAETLMNHIIKKLGINL